jgi:hypothetical protein
MMQEIVAGGSGGSIGMGAANANNATADATMTANGNKSHANLEHEQ